MTQLPAGQNRKTQKNLREGGNLVTQKKFYPTVRLIKVEEKSTKFW